MLQQVIKVEAFLAAHADLEDAHDRRRVIRNGHAPERDIQTGIGPIAVRRPKIRDRGAADGAPIRFTSAVLPAYLRRAKNVEELLPWLYLKGSSSGRFEEALAVLLGSDAPGARRPLATAADTPDKHTPGMATQKAERGMIMIKELPRQVLGRFTADHQPQRVFVIACLLKGIEHFLSRQTTQPPKHPTDGFQQARP